MDQETARIAAQELDHEEVKRQVPPDLEEKISDGTSARSSNPSIEEPHNSNGSKNHNVEVAQDEHTPPPPVKVPRSKRRGLFGRFTILAEVQEPKHYPRPTKWFITFVIAMAAMAAPLGSAIIFRIQTYTSY